MSKRKNFFGWVIAGFFLVGLVVLNAFPPDSSKLPWNDPFLIILGIAIAVICFIWARDHWHRPMDQTPGRSRKTKRRNNEP
jgi:phosphotransferase system  glucose/maltose/N-acetylglucosamine-specific IIC component